jgi:hypothetical protein
LHYISCLRSNGKNDKRGCLFRYLIANSKPPTYMLVDSFQLWYYINGYFLKIVPGEDSHVCFGQYCLIPVTSLL